MKCKLRIFKFHQLKNFHFHPERGHRLVSWVFSICPSLPLSWVAVSWPRPFVVYSDQRPPCATPHPYLCPCTFRPQVTKTNVLPTPKMTQLFSSASDLVSKDVAVFQFQNQEGSGQSSRLITIHPSPHTNNGQRTISSTSHCSDFQFIWFLASWYLPSFLWV